MQASTKHDCREIGSRSVIEEEEEEEEVAWNLEWRHSHLPESGLVPCCCCCWCCFCYQATPPQHSQECYVVECFCFRFWGSRLGCYWELVCGDLGPVLFSCSWSSSPRCLGLTFAGQRRGELEGSRLLLVSAFVVMCRLQCFMIFIFFYTFWNSYHRIRTVNSLGWCWHFEWGYLLGCIVNRVVWSIPLQILDSCECWQSLTIEVFIWCSPLPVVGGSRLRSISFGSSSFALSVPVSTKESVHDTFEFNCVGSLETLKKLPENPSDVTQVQV